MSNIGARTRRRSITIVDITGDVIDSQMIMPWLIAGRVVLCPIHTADADATKQFRRVGVGGVYWALRGR